MAITFDPESLARTQMTRKVFDVIPGSQSKVMQDHNLPKRRKNRMTRPEQIAYEAGIIDHFPKTYSGKYASRIFNSLYRTNATMFDFINIFTEYAKDQPIHKRLEIEERAGFWRIRLSKTNGNLVPPGI